MIIIKNGTVFGPDGTLKPMDLVLENEIITEVVLAGGLSPTLYKNASVIDASGCIVCPGFVDIHLHGAMGADFSDGTAEGNHKIGEYLAQHGITSFLGTSMALSEAELSHIFQLASGQVNKLFPREATLRGIHMEGPFFSKEKKGGQNEDFIINPDLPTFQRLWETSASTIRFVDIAPELLGSMDFIREAIDFCPVSLAHTTADYDTAHLAFEMGASHVTHLFNAMSPLDHRKPGVVVAAVESAATVEIICDGVHLHPAIVRLAFRLFGKNRVCIVSDSMRACGMKDGAYLLGGQQVHVNGGVATLSNGTLAGSTTNVAEGFRRAVSFGVPIEDALQAVTATPAKSAGIFDQVGSIEVGKQADILLLDEHLQPRLIFIGGKEQ